MKYINGYIVQEDKNPRYRGVDGSGFSDNTADNWVREEFVKTHRPYTLESGDFAVFEIYEVALESISRG